MSLEPGAIACLAAEAAVAKKGHNPVILDLRPVTLVADYFVITSAPTAVQVRAITEGIQARLREQGMTVRHREGYDLARWILLDYGAVVVHVLNEVERAFYNLERLWGDAEMVPWAALTPT